LSVSPSRVITALIDASALGRVSATENDEVIGKGDNTCAE
jgi:hypothetical protein